MAHVFTTSIFFSSTRVRLTCFCRLLFGCFFNSRLLLPSGAIINLPSSHAVEADQSFVFFLFRFSSTKFYTRNERRETERTAFFFFFLVDGVFLSFLIGDLCLMNGLQTSIKDVQERNYS